MSVLEVKSIRKNFKIPGHKPVEVLKGVDFSVEKGERVAIVGRSGSGKSTLLHILGGLLKPTSGEVRRCRNIGFVFQAYHLMPELTVLENVFLPTMAKNIKKAVALANAKRLLKDVGLEDRMDHLPGELSGGERQRAALARALVTDPDLVLADEPTGNLDTKASVEIMKLFTELSAEGITIVMVTHEDDIAAYAKRQLVMRDGKLVKDVRR